MEGNGFPLVFIHDIGTDGRIWKEQMAFFSQNYRVIAMDLPAHGKSSPFKDEIYTIERTAHALKEGLDVLQIDQAVFVGVSMGAAVAMKIAHNYPSTARGLVLVSPWCYLDNEVMMKKIILLAEEQGLEPMLNYLSPYFFSGIIFKDHPEVIDKWKAIGLDQDQDALLPALTACLALDLRWLIKSMAVPILFVTGPFNLLIPPPLVKAIAEQIPGAQVEVMEERGHFPFLEEPEGFNKLIESFISKILHHAN